MFKVYNKKDLFDYECFLTKRETLMNLIIILKEILRNYQDQ